MLIDMKFRTVFDLRFTLSITPRRGRSPLNPKTGHLSQGELGQITVEEKAPPSLPHFASVVLASRPAKIDR